MNAHLVQLEDKVYDLEKGGFVDCHPALNHSMSTGWKWQERNDEDIAFLRQLIEDILPVPAERNCYMEVLATGLEGRTLQNFIQAIGEGGNGKGVLNDLVCFTLGDYAAKSAPNTIADH